MKRTIIIVVSIMMIGGMMAAKKDALETYKKKRDFSATTEPKGASPKHTTKDPIFVIQKHDATALHYDVRLEVDGVLKSWAVPKGPSTNPSVKHLAIPTEDHPIEYAQFEGVIPEGNYGAGPVMIWDYGTYKNIKKDKNDKALSMEQALKKGTIEVWLEGKKLQGGYALIRMKDKPGQKKEQWLLVKMDDEKANRRKKITTSESKSAVSGRTMKQIEKS